MLIPHYRITGPEFDRGQSNNPIFASQNITMKVIKTIFASAIGLSAALSDLAQTTPKKIGRAHV